MELDLRLEKLARRAIAVMSQEREMALRGDLDSLSETTAMKEALMAELEATIASVDRMAPSPLRDSTREDLRSVFSIIRRRAEENQALLRAALTGLKSASQNVARLRDPEADIGAYDPEGRTIPSAANTGGASDRY